MESGFYRKLLASAAVFFLLVDIHRVLELPASRLVLYLTIWLTFTAAMFVPKRRWTPTRGAVASGLVVAQCAVGLIWQHETRLWYVLALLLFVIALRLSLARSQTQAIAVLFVTAALYNRFGHADLFSLLSFALLAVVLYLFVRSRTQRNEAFGQIKRHLAELQEAYERLQEASAANMRFAIMEERTRIARDIHDAVGHSLTSLIVQMQALRYMMKDDPAQADRSVDGMLDVARRGLRDIRTSVHALAGDRTEPRIAALRSLLSRMEDSTAVACRFDTRLRDEEIRSDAFEALYRVLQESITNTLRHSGATLLQVELREETGRIVMRVRDNGQLDPGAPIDEGFGLRTMKARLEEMGGSLRYGGAKPSGFELVAVVPNEEAYEPADAGGEQ
ncbi:sensor histidine kinase [Cohnella sp. 56]|uniref:sensor histidine kinase n=1 Tax=Cohnella sp. 56 TaxID=3113722 RepID=UPI0030E9510F